MSTEVVIFACQQAVPDPKSFQAKWGKGEARLRLLSEPCSSKVEAFQMLRTLATPVDLVWVIGCAENLCRYQEGSHRLAGRVKYAQRYLEEIGLEADRLGHSLVSPGDAKNLAGVMTEIKARIKSLGPSPLKGKG
jgi:F420-non-reducing hydrogenase iron-sulfur subunit